MFYFMIYSKGNIIASYDVSNNLNPDFLIFLTNIYDKHLKNNLHFFSYKLKCTQTQYKWIVLDTLKIKYRFSDAHNKSAQLCVCNC